jgi:hypothetical protein
VDFRKDSEGICVLQKGFSRYLWTSEWIQKASVYFINIQNVSVDFRKNSEGICELQKGFSRYL